MDVRVRISEGSKLYWRGRDRVGGEIIEVPEKEARLIVAVKKGELVEKPATQKLSDPQPVQTRGQKPETVTTPRYRRRDMRSE